MQVEYHNPAMGAAVSTSNEKDWFLRYTGVSLLLAIAIGAATSSAMGPVGISAGMAAGVLLLTVLCLYDYFLK
jgi:hypothetical protein